MEIELKLVCQRNALSIFEEKLLPLLASKELSILQSQAHLYNEYYDTPSQFFGKRHMGFRVRAKNHQYEQTIKTRGQVNGGLHQRPEYNIKLDSAQPDLSLFSVDIWGEPFDVKAVNDQLTPLFSTHFDRTTFELTHADFKIEVVFDVGEVKRDQDSLPICEIELELVEGEAIHLFSIAEQLVSYVPCRLSDVTKAARGYMLMQGSVPETKKLPQFVRLNDNESTEDAFCKTIELGLHHWQHHQQVYAQTNKLKSLTEIRRSISVLLQAVALYLPVLQCAELLSLHKQLLVLNRVWAWQEQLESIHQLRSRKGPFSRRIPKNQNVMNYLMGRREGLLNAHKPHDLNMSVQSAKVQLATSKLLLCKPWREQQEGTTVSVKKHANGWLSQSWQTVVQSLPNQGDMDDKQYLAVEALLNQSLLNGFMLADLFAESRGQFRAPWLDLSTGIEELKALSLLHTAFDDLNLEDKADFSNWIEDKTHSVIKVMEQTRKAAIEQDIYW
ncbi:MAG: CYTH domain-containing protein [Glaciecola sp.]